MANDINLLSRFLKEEADAISTAARRLDKKEVDKAIEILESCSRNKSKLVVSGVGKSGLVARKIAATFSSVGLMAIFLNPTDALHGDLGIVSEGDCCLLLSNSGETVEMISIMPHLKRRGANTIALVGRGDSTLAHASDVVLVSSVDREVCPLNLAPTASTTVAMAIGDALAALWTERQNISSADFAMNHPAGSLGKRLTMTVADLMVPVSKLPSLRTTSTVEEVIGVLTQGVIGSGWVEDPKNPQVLLGLITDGDLRRALRSHKAKDWQNLTAEDMLTPNPIKISINKLAIEAIRLMEENCHGRSISVLPVVDENGIFEGFVCLHDLVQEGLVQ